MSYRPNGQAGFSASIFVVALVVVLVIAGVCFTVFKRSSDTRTATTPADRASLPTAHPAAPQEQTPTTAYLDIREWGVKLPL